MLIGLRRGCGHVGAVDSARLPRLMTCWSCGAQRRIEAPVKQQRPKSLKQRVHEQCAKRLETIATRRRKLTEPEEAAAMSEIVSAMKDAHEGEGAADHPRRGAS